MRVNILVSLVFVLISPSFQPLYAQLGFDLKVDKPKPYEDRVLRSEKTPDKQASPSKKFFQNLSTHYNYFFNANNKLNEVIDRAKAVHKDDYTSLLPFYNYSLDITSQDKTQLDSVIYKSQTGIVMHDLRNDWIDNLYLLWGAAYFLEKKFDSAALMFQFINYAFAEKEKDGYYKYIGSRMDGNNALTISTKENRSFPKNLVTPPSRNNAFIWQARTLIESGNLAEAGSLMATLKNDPVFPKRLNDDLEELQAYWYYKQNVWDSSAAHLIKAFDQAKTKEEKARWEYLAAQMFEKTGKLSEAEKFYTKAIAHTNNPVMDVYARLNLVRINKTGGENYIDKNIAELLRMAKKDRYEDYRDIIYFMAAQMEMERNNFVAAQELLLKGSKYNNANFSSRNKAYLLIADLSYDQKKYLLAASFYDSVKTTELDGVDARRIETRKPILSKLVGFKNTIARQDSLQRIAAMPEAERTAFITSLVKHLRKQQGLEENGNFSGNPMLTSNTPVDLFPNEQAKGEWYFYNNTLKTQGVVQFKQIWGNRPNVDNWRRFADVNQQLVAKAPNITRNTDITDVNSLPIDNNPTFNSLFANLPITATQLQHSNDSLQSSLFNLGTVYLNDVEDYNSAIEVFERLRSRFHDYKNMNEVLFNLYYAYKKIGDNVKGEQIKKLLLTQYPNSRFAAIIATGKDPAVPNAKTTESTKTYEAIYDQFIEGKFDEAEAAKKIADSTYKTNYWQPQLLYIEAVYNIRQRNDSLAKNSLQTIIAQNPGSPMAVKAQTMFDVLSRRKQIEDELTRLQIERPKEDSTVIQNPVVQKPVVLTYLPPAKKDSSVTKPKNDVVINHPPKKTIDTTARKPLVPQTPASVYKSDPSTKHYVMIILDKVDPMFVNEVRNAFLRYDRETYPGQPIQINAKDFDADKKFLLIGDFANMQNAVDYLQKAKRIAASEIIPWLKPDKFSFTIMTDPNLQTLLQKKDLNEYKKFLDQTIPVKL